MENENKNIENENPVHPEGEVKTKTGGGKTAVILAVTLMAGLLTGGGIYKLRHGANTEKTVEVKERVTTVTVVSDPAYEAEETIEEVTMTEASAEETTTEETTVTTVPETEETAYFSKCMTPVTMSKTALEYSSEDIGKFSPLKNKNHVVYPDILRVIPEIEFFNRDFYGFYAIVYRQDTESDAEIEYRDIVVGADVTYSYHALKSTWTPPGSEKIDFSPVGGALHSKRYCKMSDLLSGYTEKKYKTKDEVYAALEEYFTDSFIENHYISNYDEVPGRNTIFKIIDGELYLSTAEDVEILMVPSGNIYNYDGKRCEVNTEDIHISLVLEDGKWKIDGYEHTDNIVGGTSYNTAFYYDKYHEICEKAVEDLMALEGVALGCGVTTDENDTLTEEIGGMTVVYQRVTDERFSNVTEVENYICSHSIADLRLRCIDYIRGVNSTFPLYKMSEGVLYCNVHMAENYRLSCLNDNSKDFNIISADDNFIQLGFNNFNYHYHFHNSLFLKNTADGWKIYEMD